MIGDYYVDIDKVGPDLFHWSPHYVIMRVSDLVIGATCCMYDQLCFG